MTKSSTIISIIIAILVLAGIIWLAYYFMQAPGPASSLNPNNISNENINTNTPPEKTFAVDGQNFSFSPAEIKVKLGDKVKITFNNVSGFHDFVIDEYSVKTDQFQGPGTREINFLANKTGTFEYYCSVGTHRQMGMKGNFIVE